MESFRLGQGTVEAVGLLAGLLIVILVVAIAIPEQAAQLGVERNRQMAVLAAQDIAKAADEVYLSGDGARKSVWIELPETYNASLSFVGNRPGTAGTLFQNRTIGIYLLGTGELLAETKAPLCGNLPASGGKYLVTVYYNNSGHAMVNASC